MIFFRKPVPTFRDHAENDMIAPTDARRKGPKATGPKFLRGEPFYGPGKGKKSVTGSLA
jgi:hypothetical protein